MKRIPTIALYLIFQILLSCKQESPALSPFASAPDWSRLELFQETVTRQEFEDLLKNVYTEDGSVPNFIEVLPDRAVIRKSPRSSRENFILRFAASPDSKKKAPQYWREDPLFFPSHEKPLKGLKIALDPGHIGGAWAKLEQRWFQIGDSPPIAEGELTLTVAKLLTSRLKSLGAEVYLVRSELKPLTSLKPPSLQDAEPPNRTEARLSATQESDPNPSDQEKKASLQNNRELMAFQNGEIRERARVINESLKPDLILCIHFDAQRWTDPNKPALLHQNQFHLLIPGSFTAQELEWEDVRLEMLVKLLNRSHFTEIALAQKLASAIANLTGQLPGNYPPEAHVKKLDSAGYIWARHLLVSRLYQSPVIVLEPYTMNDEDVFQRIQAGDYAGERIIGGMPRKSLFREYADAVVAGLLGYYSHPRIP
jgi:N-acetylmuramoyl-L-alanine amidase